MSNPHFDAHLQLQIIEDCLTRSQASASASNQQSEGIVSRIVVNRAFNAVYLHIRAVLDNEGCARPKAHNFYYSYFYCVQDILLYYGGPFIFGRLEKFFEERKKADYNVSATCFPYPRARAAIRNAKEIIREFERAKRDKVRSEGHLC